MSIKKSILICVGEHFSNLNLVPVFLCNRTVWFRAVGADSYSWSADESGLDWQPSQHIGPRSLFTQSSSFVLQLGTQHVDVRRSIHASALSIVRWRVVVRCRFWLWLWNSQLTLLKTKTKRIYFTLTRTRIFRHNCYAVGAFFNYWFLKLLYVVGVV